LPDHVSSTVGDPAGCFWTVLLKGVLVNRHGGLAPLSFCRRFVLQQDCIEGLVHPACPLTQSGPWGPIVGFGDYRIDVLFAGFLILSVCRQRVTPVAVRRLAVGIDPDSARKPFSRTVEGMLFEV